MAHTSERITAPVRLTQDLQPVLGIAGGLGYIVQNAELNQWSFRKPFCSTYKAFPNDDVRLSEMKAANMGFTITQHTWLPYFLEHYKDKWVYNRPDLNLYPARMLDFNGYVTQAVVNREWGTEGVEIPYLYTIFRGSVWSQQLRPSLEVVLGENIHFEIGAVRPDGEDVGLLYVRDFDDSVSTKLANYYLGLMFLGRSNRTWIITNGTQLKNISSNEAHIPNTSFPSDNTGFPVGGSFDVVPIFCASPFTTLQVITEDTIPSIVTFNGQYITFRRIASGTTVTVGALYWNGTHINVDVTVANNSGSTANFSRMFAYTETGSAYQVFDTQVWEKVREWVSTGAEYTNGIFEVWTRGEIARYKNYSSFSVPDNDTRVVTIDLGEKLPTDGEGHEYDITGHVYICYTLNYERNYAD